jgi:NHLM bacteriocin system ABC transporter peptidase/ATP-binding protein
LLQTELVECGAAALGIVLDYHGCHVELPALREMCKVSRDGQSAAAILDAATALGLNGGAFSCDTIHLRTLRPPYIAFWNFDHFLVVEGFDRNHVYLNDPSIGRHRVSHAEFDRSFTGVVLVFEKGAEFRKCGAQRSILRSLWRRLRGQKLNLGFVAISTLALVAPGTIAAVLPKVFFDTVIERSAAHWLHPLLAVMFLTAVVLSALTFLQQRALARVETNLAIQSEAGFFHHVLRLPMRFFAQRDAGSVMETISANERVAALLAGDIATNVANALLAGLYLAVMLRYDTWLTVIVLAIACVNTTMLRLIARRRSEDSQKIAKERSELCGVAVAGVSGIESWKAMGAEDEFFKTWTGRHVTLLSAEQDMQQSQLVITALSPLFSAVGGAAILGLGGLRIMDGVMSIGMLVAFQTLMSSFLDPFGKLLNMGSKLQQIHGDLHRLDDVLGYPADQAPDCAREPSPASQVAGEVEFRNVTFGYNQDEPLLRNFNLHIAPGTRVAIVGPSGSGKSTIAKLLCGLHRPSSGQVSSSGRISLVDQDIVLFEGSIAENISLLDDNLERDTVIAAAKDASVHDEIMSKPRDYAFQLEHMGRNLSGGQRQRVEIARALAVNPRILILDEGTSALDPLTERAVMDNIRRRGCTCIVVAHRISAVRDCDEIIVLERGEIVEHGSHGELLSRHGRYAALVAEN